MRGTSELLGAGFSLTWRRTKDRTRIDWPSIAADWRIAAVKAGVEPETLATLASIHTSTEPGTRPFRLVLKGDLR